MDDQANPLGWHVWRRGVLLGLRWAAVFFAVTALIYLALGGLGWSGVARALCAMAVGPFVGMGAIAAWWALRRPARAGGDARAEQLTVGRGEPED